MFVFDKINTIYLVFKELFRLINKKTTACFYKNTFDITD